MSVAEDLEGPQDQGGKHGGQQGMPSPPEPPHDQGIVRDGQGQEQPRDKDRALHVSRSDSSDAAPAKNK